MSSTEPSAAQARPPVEVRRSRRRTRNVTAFREDGRIVVAIPAHLTAAQERQWVERMVERLTAKEQRRRPADAELVARAADLSRRYLDGRARPTSVAWVTNQTRRWGSATPATGEIRISSMLRGVPPWVLDAVLVHELTHLVHADHGPQFHALTARYPRLAEAEAFLAGITWYRAQHGEGGPASLAGDDLQER